MADARAIWEARYARLMTQANRLTYEPWLEAWREFLPAGIWVLDAGCGPGYDTRWLHDAGLRVLAADCSSSALGMTRIFTPGALLANVDLRDGLPFAPGVFGAIVANLCLHYFPLPQTAEMIGQMRVCLPPGGALIARFNSTHDRNYGAGDGQPVEPGAYVVDGMYKRFFDRNTLMSLFARGWRVHFLEEKTILSYHDPKVLWELVALKAAA